MAIASQYNRLHIRKRNRLVQASFIKTTYRFYRFLRSEEDDEIGQGASAQWQLHLNTIDCTLGREIALSKHLSSKPHIGFIASCDLKRMMKSVKERLPNGNCISIQ